jgi:hypothetical protein
LNKLKAQSIIRRSTFDKSKKGTLIEKLRDKLKENIDENNVSEPSNTNRDSLPSSLKKNN